MALPKNVQRQLDEAEAQAAAQAPTAQPDGLVTDMSQLLAAPVEQAPAAQPAPPPPPSEDWLQKYRSLQGMYSAEVPALRTKLVTTESELVALRGQGRALTAATKQKAEAPAEPDPRDVAAFGQDMLDMVRRYAEQTIGAVRSDVQGVLGSIEARIATLEKTVTGVSQKADTTLEAQFYATLGALVPDWRDINAAQDWLAWLEQVDDVYGVPRQAALDAAHNKADAQQVARVFLEFKKSRSPKPSASLEGQLSPGAGGATASVVSQPAARQMLSQKAVQDFYRDMARNKYVGREAEAARIESEINAAAREGRII